MTTDIELTDFAQKKKQEEEEAIKDAGEGLETELRSLERRDASVAAWAWTSASVLTLLCFPLLLFPRFLLFLSVSGDFSETTLTPLESFLATHFAFFLLGIAVALVLYIPSEEPLQVTRRRDALGHPLLGPVTAACLVSSFVAYNTSSVSTLAFVVCVASGFIGLFGFWVILFEGTSRISRKTGADKHTSAFLFHNKSAASAQKKEWKKEQKEKDS